MIAIFAFFLLWGTVGALECGTISFTRFFIQCTVIMVIAIISTVKRQNNKRRHNNEHR